MTKMLPFAALIAALFLTSCRQKPAGPVSETAVNSELTDCNISFGNVTFTKALNRADTCVAKLGDGRLLFRCEEGRDIFNDPNGKLSNHTIPALFTEVDNTKPFTIVAKLTPEFSEEGQYNAADLIVYANDSLYQKFCFEQDERGRHRAVTVRTVGTSDDNNHGEITAASVYYKISSDATTIACYYSTDKKEWQMVRLYRNDYPELLYVGIASQCPQRGRCNSIFEELSLEFSSPMWAISVWENNHKPF